VRAVRAEQRNLLQHKSADPEADHHLALRLGRSAMAAAPDAQALMLPGGLWFAIHAAPLLEAEFGVPVLLNITATVWSAMHAVRGSLPTYPGDGAGRLLAGWPWVGKAANIPDKFSIASQNRTLSRIVVQGMRCLSRPSPPSRWRNTWISQD